MGFEPQNKGVVGFWVPMRSMESIPRALAPQSGHVSNFCGLTRGPIEPVQFLSVQSRTGKTGTPIQAGYPAEILLEPERISDEIDRSVVRKLLYATSQSPAAARREVTSQAPELSDVFRSARNDPITSASRFVRRKVRMASVGEQTIGSSASLNDVLSSTGHPDNFPTSIRSA